VNVIPEGLNLWCFGQLLSVNRKPSLAEDEQGSHFPEAVEIHLIDREKIFFCNSHVTMPGGIVLKLPKQVQACWKSAL
jgi:hypothetical protein